MEEGQRGQHDRNHVVMYVITLKDFLYNDFTVGGNGGSGSLGSSSLDFLGNRCRSNNFLGGSKGGDLFGGRHGEK